MKLEVGMYVRTKRDGIAKIISLSIGEEEECCFIELSKRRTGIKEHNITKASHNIIDLIEVEDYVNGYKVRGTSVSTLLLDNFNMIQIDEEDIKSIVTKEQFKSMSYRVERDEV